MIFVLDHAGYYHGICFSEEPDKLEVTEIRPSHNSHELQRTQIPDANVELWSTKNSLDETEAPALLRLVWVRKRDHPRVWELDTRRSSLDTVLKNFELEEAHRYSFAIPAVFALMPVRQTEHSDTAAFSLCFPNLLGIAWKHDARSGRTEGVFWGEDWAYQAMWRMMNKMKEWAQHPLFLALVASIMFVDLLDKSLVREHVKIGAVEARTKYHGYINNAVEIAQGDYTSLSQRMSACAGVLAAVELDHKVLGEFLIDISLYSQRYDIGDDPSSRKIRSEMEDCVETLKRRLKMQKIELDFFTRRVEIQLTAVRDAPFITHLSMIHPPMSLPDPVSTQLFHLISQQEAKVGIAVAEDSRTLASASKEDSTAMKTIAAVTIVFLPGTSVAALFAMPLFEWDAVGDSKVVSNRFWIYWAVTIPLTFLTLLFWVLWTKRQARMHKSSEKRAREELRSDIEGQRGDGVEKKEI